MTPVASLPAAGRNLDCLVAQRLFGVVLTGERGDFPRSMVPVYSTSIAAAWEIVEKLRGDWRFLFQETPGRAWRAVFASHSQHEVAFMADAKTAPEAICLAALKAVAP